MDPNMNLDDALAKFRFELDLIEPVYKTGKISKLLDRLKKARVYSSSLSSKQKLHIGSNFKSITFFGLKRSLCLQI